MTKHTISAEQLLKAYNGKYKYVTMDSNKGIAVWAKKPTYADGDWGGFGLQYYLEKIAITEFQNKPAEECLYKAKPSEEDMIGCVGFFWDDYTSGGSYGILQAINNNLERPYKPQFSGGYKHFRPATRDEIKFFNDDTSEE